MLLARSVHFWLASDRCCGAGIAGRVLGDDLLQSNGQYLPRKDLDVLFDVSWLGIGESHDDLEELLCLGFGLGHRIRFESFKVSSDSVLLLDGEADSDQRLK